MNTKQARRIWKNLRKKEGWSSRVDNENRQQGVDLDGLLKEAHNNYHPPSKEDRKRLLNAADQED